MIDARPVTLVWTELLCSRRSHRSEIRGVSTAPASDTNVTDMQADTSARFTHTTAHDRHVPASDAGAPACEAEMPESHANEIHWANQRVGERYQGDGMPSRRDGKAHQPDPFAHPTRWRAIPT